MAVSTPITTHYDVGALREQQFPLTRNTVYFNCAAIAPLPQRTFDEMRAADERLLLDPSGSFETFFLPRFTNFAEAIRALINAEDVSEIAGVSSTSMGMNVAAQALPWQAGQNIILCDMEFPSNVYPWMSLQAQRGVEVRVIPNQDGGLTLEALEKAVDANTRLVTASAVQFFTGHKTDLKAIGAFCHDHNILFAVDVIQSAGHLPIDVQAMHIDVLATGGQKSLMGPPGQGFLYMCKALIEKTRPTMVGGSSVQDFHHWLKYNLTPADGAARFQMGTPNLNGMMGLLESITMLRELGIAAIDSYTTTLANFAIDQLKTAGYPVITPDTHGPIVTFRAAETEEANMALMEALKAQRIFVTKHWDQQDISHIRLSFHCFNTTEEISHLIDALAQLRN
ncbi:MAG: aminotransferase class V-fold PLP-dependent enzyme [Chloroflexota bacterium]